MREATRRTLIVGWRGGVGRAVLAVLDGHALAQGRTLLLLDAEPGHDGAPPGATVLPAERIASGARVQQLLRAHAIDELVDVAGLDWRDCLDACAATGASYLCTSLERWSPAEGVLDDAVLLASAAAPKWRGRHLVAAGMNPGCVNALVEVAIDEFAARVGTTDLALAAIHVTELDTTHATSGEPDGFAMSWGAAPCLAELRVPNALVVVDGAVQPLPHAPTQQRYRARCGDAVIEGFAVPHDELVSLGARHRGTELAYVYRVPDHAARWLATHDHARTVTRLWPPHTRALAGIDRVGVLLCSRTFGELWCGFETDVAEGLQLGTNATLLQVAAGVVAGWAQLHDGDGVRVVEQLDTRAYLRDVATLLGPFRVVHDPHAPFTPLADRRCPSS